MENSDDIMRVLGKLEEGQRNAEISRGVLYDKIDDVNKNIATVVTSLQEDSYALRSTTAIANAVRQDFDEFKEAFSKEVEPLIVSADTFRKQAAPIVASSKAIQRSIKILIGVMAGGSISIIGILVGMNSLAKAVILAWLNAP